MEKDPAHTSSDTHFIVDTVTHSWYFVTFIQTIIIAVTQPSVGDTVARHFVRALVLTPGTIVAFKMGEKENNICKRLHVFIYWFRPGDIWAGGSVGVSEKAD